MSSIKAIIETSSSQALQDIFAYYINKYSTNGYFLDLGCNEPIINNNTFILEKMGWKGILVDYDASLVNLCSQYRSNPVICADLVNTNISDILTEYKSPDIIDYVSLDLDNGAAFPCIKSFDFNKFKIRCMTFEHDYYQHGEQMRRESREFLKEKGMEIICEDVTIFNGKSFEDWYVNPDLVDKELYNSIRCKYKEYISIFDSLL